MPGLSSLCGSNAARTPRDKASEAALGDSVGQSEDGKRSKIRTSRAFGCKASSAASGSRPFA
jgi:hypothetical protein